jgi:predicted MFS family arabinose efflux permease
VLVLSPVLPKIAEALGASVGAIGQLRTVSGGVACITALALGRRPAVQLRNLIGAGVALLALGSLSSAVAPTLTALGLAQVPIGVGLAAVLVGAVAAAGEWPSAERRTGVVAWTLVGQAAAWVVGMPVVGIVAATAGWRAALMALPVSASVLALVALRGAPTGWAPNRARDRRWLLRPAVARWALGEVLAFSAWSGTLVYAGAMFATSYGAGPAAVGLVLGAGAAAYLPGNLAARRWVDRSAATAAGVLALLASVGVLVLFAARPSLGISAALFAAMAGVGGARTLAGSVRGLELGGSQPVVSTGVRAAAQQLGYLVGAGLGGAVLDAAGPAGLGVALSLLFGSAGAVSLLRARNGRSGDRPAGPSFAGSLEVVPVPRRLPRTWPPPPPGATATRRGQGVERHPLPVASGTEPTPPPT